MIYFIDDRRGAVKIGYSQNPESRVKGIGHYHAFAIHLLATMPGDQRDEKELHNKFSHLRLNGEWFLKTRELVEFIAKVNPKIDIDKVLCNDDPVREKTQQVIDKVRETVDGIMQDVKDNALVVNAMREATNIISNARANAITVKNTIIGKAHEEANDIRQNVVDKTKEETTQIISNAKKQADQALEKAREQVDDIKKSVLDDPIVSDARKQAEQIVDNAMEEAIEVIEEAKVDARDIVAEARKRSVVINSRIKAALDLGEVMPIFDSRCCNCGCATLDVKERDNGLPFCQECWKQHLNYQEIVAKAYGLGYGRWGANKRY